MDSAPIWSDLKTFPSQEFRDRVDLLVAGYPCQPFSAAGKRLGTEDPRHLWPHIAGSIRVIRPRFCFFENVEGHISLGLREVIGELEEIGYQTAWGIFSAAEVGAPHQRKRVFILAYDKSQRIQGHGADWLQESRPHAGQGLPLRGGDAECLANSNDQHGHGEERGGSPEEDRISSEHREEEHPRWELGRADAAGPKGCGELADASCHGHNGRQLQDGMDRWKGGQLPQSQRGESGSLRCKTFGCRQVWPSRPGQAQHGWEPPRVVANSESQRARGRSELCGEECGSRGALPRLSGQSGEVVGNADHGRLASGIDAGSGTEADRGGQSDIEQADGGLGDAATSRRPQHQPRFNDPQNDSSATDQNEHVGQAQPPLGGNSDGPADWMDYAELYTTCDNRTDELRLLGNGVVPATAERAFRTLLTELLTPQKNDN